MKKLFITLTVLLCSAMAFAENPFVFGYFGAQYNKISMDSDGYSTDMNGVTLGGDVFRNISGNWYVTMTPLNVQVGWKSKTEGGIKFSAYFVSMKPSFGLSYRIPISDNDDIALYPYAGFDIGAYIDGESSMGKEKINWFKDLKYNRFIFNWHAGATLNIKKISFIVKYEGYIVPIYNQNSTKSGLNQWSFGIAFEV